MTIERQPFSRILQSDEQKAKRKRGDQKRLATKRETRLAKETGGRRQPASGALSQKGDVKEWDVLYDDKYTGAKSFVITQQAIAKLCDEAQGEGGLIPAMTIGFTTPIQELKWHSKEWVLIPKSTLLELLNER